MGKYNFAKYCSYGLNANIDPLVDSVEVIHTPAGVSDVVADGSRAELTVKVSGSSAEFSEVADVYAASGALVASKARSVELPGGIYIAKAGNSEAKFVVK